MRWNFRSMSPALALVLLAVAAGACSGASEPAPGEALRLVFPAHADRVLATPGAFAASERGFTVLADADAPALGPVLAELPREGEGVIKLALSGGGEVRVREVGARGAGVIAEHAVAYPREGGTSYWSVVTGGVEEWLHLGAGAAAKGGAVAAWQVEGVTAREVDHPVAREMGGIVELVDGGGIPRVRVTAPAAYAAGGRPIGVHLHAHGTTIELYVDPTSDAVLVDPQWVSTGTMNVTRRLHAGVKLNDGRVLVSGGIVNSSSYNATAEIYDPVTGVWSLTGSMSAPRGQHTLTALPNGQVLVAGGFGSGTNNYPQNVELFDPATGTFSVGPALPQRTDHTATLLPNGKVLIAGGNPGAAILQDAWLYDPATGTLGSAGTMPHGHQDHTATVLTDGRVLVVGCYSGTSNYNTMIATDVYTPATNTWASAPTPLWPHAVHVAGRLPDGRVLITGGREFQDRSSAKTEIFNPATNTWSLVASMSVGRDGAAGTVLGDGTFLVAGGYDSNGSWTPLATTERYDPATNTWTAAGTMAHAHYRAAAATLDNGYVLIAGGQAAPSFTDTGTTELYTTLAGNGAACTSASQCVSGACVDGVCCNSACGGGVTTDCQACSVAAGAAQNGTCGPIYTGSCAVAQGGGCTAASQCGTGFCVDGVCCDAACGGNVTTDCQACSAAAGASQDGTCTTLTTGTCGLAQNGAACSASSQCGSGFCVDGVCCNSACGGGSTTDCQACSVAAGASQDGTCATLTTGTCGTTCLTIQRGTSGTVADAHLVSTSGTSNYGANQILSTGGISGSTRYGLFSFDLSAIPSGSVITQATLTLGFFSGGAATENVHRITAPWSESSVTWNSFASAFDTSVSTTLTGSSTYTGDVSSLVQSWVNGTFPNYGLLIERDLSNATNFYASEYTTVANRPKLYVCYHP